MSTNNEPEARKPQTGTPIPAVKGDSGQYGTGDYGDAGTVDASPDAQGSGEYADGDYEDAGTVDASPDAQGSGEYSEGDYGDAGTAHQDGVAARQPNDSPEDQDAVPRRPDDDKQSGPRRD